MSDVWLLTREFTAKYDELMNAEKLVHNIDTHISIWTPMSIRSGFNKLDISTRIFKITDIDDKPLPKLVIDCCPPWTQYEAKKLLDIEAAGTIVVNKPKSHILYHDKWNQAKVLMDHGINIAKVIKIDLPPKQEKIEELGELLGYPLVIKGRNSCHAFSVFKCNSEDDVFDACMELYNMKTKIGFIKTSSVIAQKWIDHRSLGILRVQVIGYKAIAAQQRVPKIDTDFFISNHIEDSIRSKYIMPQELIDLCEAACRALDVEMATLDVMHDGKNFIICELNTMGGFKQLAISNPQIDFGFEIAKYVAGYLK
jgi:glutathione synthase/RimK-type ligase-like ATP-grasp enzyme